MDKKTIEIFKINSHTLLGEIFEELGKKSKNGDFKVSMSDYENDIVTSKLKEMSKLIDSLPYN